MNHYGRMALLSFAFVLPLAGCANEDLVEVRPQIASVQLPATQATASIDLRVRYVGGDDDLTVRNLTVDISRIGAAYPETEALAVAVGSFDAHFPEGVAREATMRASLDVTKLRALCGQSVEVRVRHGYVENPGITSVSLPYVASLACP